MLLSSTDAVAAFCRELRDAPYVTVDTEFLTEKRYRPKLCLVQLGAPGLAAAIDPLAEGIDLSPVAELLTDPDLLKVFHAGRQDVAIFLHRFGAVPAPLFDTQVAASVCGFGDQAGYGRLCSELLGRTIDKVQQTSDWSVRPLSQAQVDYALGDVTHLCDLYEALVARLDALGRRAWVDEELAGLSDPTTHVVDPEQAWKRVRIRRPTPKVVAVVAALAAWRERTAVQRDQPRGWVVRDEALVEIAQQLPSSVEELSRVRRVGAKIATGRQGREILRVVAETLVQPEDQWPVIVPPAKLSTRQRATILGLQGLLRVCCDVHDVGEHLVATSKELERFVAGDHEGLRMLSGWRAEVFGRDAQAFLAGRIRLAVAADGGLEVVEV